MPITTLAGRLKKSPASSQIHKLMLIPIPVRTSWVPSCFNLKVSLAKCLCVRGNIPVTGCSSKVVNYLISLATLLADFSCVCTCIHSHNVSMFACGTIFFVLEDFSTFLHTFLTNITRLLKPVLHTAVLVFVPLIHPA